MSGSRERFTPGFHIYVAKWLRAKQPQHLWSLHSEQYRKAWFASFFPNLWPVEEGEDPDGRIFLKLKDRTMFSENVSNPLFNYFGV